MEKQEIETRETCNECGEEFLMSHICIKCRQKRNLLTEKNLLQVSGKVNLISINDIKDGDLIVLKFDGSLSEFEDLSEFEEASKQISEQILEITQKKVVFIGLSAGMDIDHISEAQLNSIGLAKTRKNDKKTAEIG